MLMEAFSVIDVLKMLRSEKRKIVLLSIYDSFEILFNPIIATEKIIMNIAVGPTITKAF